MVSTTAPPRRPDRPRPPRPRAAERRRLAEQRALRRALVLLGGTLLVPGGAQYAVGSRRVGRIAMLTWAALVVAIVLARLLVSREWLLGVAVRPFWLGTFTVLAWALGLAWALLLLDAWRLARPPELRRLHRVAIAMLALLLCVGVVVPFAYSAWLAALQRDLVVSLFPTGEAAAASGGRINVLLLGADTGDDRVGTRTDSIHLLSADVTTGRSVLFSLPRNLERVPFADGSPMDEEFPRGFRGEGDESEWLLNAVYTYAQDRPELYPDADEPGVEAVRDAVAGALDQDVHYYAMVDMAGFEGLVDALGGVTLNVTETVEIPDGSLTIPPGVQHMDGVTALWYARSRTGSDDYARMARQKCVIGAVARQADPSTVVRNFEDIAASTTGTVSTDVPQDALPQLLELALRGKDLGLTTVQFVPPLVVPASPDYDAVREAVQDAIDASELLDVEAVHVAKQPREAATASESGRQVGEDMNVETSPGGDPTADPERPPGPADCLPEG